MHILLTDLLTCPRCGPEFGLIVLADRLEDRQVVEGRLGCANCRASYPIEAGVADLRHPVVPPLEAIGALAAGDGAPPPDSERAFRTAALLGVNAGGSSLLVVEPELRVAAELSEVLPEVHVLAMSGASGAARQGRVGVMSRFLGGGRFPLRDRSVRGVALLGVKPEPLLDEIRRVLVPGGRLVVDPAAAEVPERLREAAFSVLLEQEGVVVAAISEPR